MSDEGIHYEEAGLFDADPNPRSLEDYRLWARVLKSTKARCFGKVLVRYRVNNDDSIQRITRAKWFRMQRYLLRSADQYVEVNVFIHSLNIALTGSCFLVPKFQGKKRRALKTANDT